MDSATARRPAALPEPRRAVGSDHVTAAIAFVSKPGSHRCSHRLRSERDRTERDCIVKHNAKYLFALFFITTGPAAAEPYVVAALAADANAVVLAAPDGHLLRYRRGELLADSAWRVAEVREDEVVFARPLPGRGGALNVGVKRGASIDFNALDRHQAAPPAPQPQRQFRLTPLPRH